MSIFGRHKEIMAGKVNLAKASEVRRVQKVMIEMVENTKALTRNDIKNWRSAWQEALAVEYPSRYHLYNIYRDAEMDLHLTGCRSQRSGFIKRKAFKLVDTKSGEENPDITKYFKQTWFIDFVDIILRSIYWGTSLIELGDIIFTDDTIKFEEVKLVPMTHVIPEKGVILKYESDDWHNGYDYLHSEMANWCIQVGKTDDLGLLLKLAVQTIPKKNQMAFWDQFSEIFGMPIRIGKTNVQSPEERSQVENMLSKMGAAAWGLFPDGTDIEIKESSKTDSYKVYDMRIERANSEISKAILNETMTIDNGSSKSQSETHLNVFENLIESDADYIKNIINNELIPRMILHGFPIAGYLFDWDKGVSYSPEQQMAYEEMISSQYEVDPDYYIKKYNVPIIGKKAAASSANLKKDFFD
jgi:hypothetical protein